MGFKNKDFSDALTYSRDGLGTYTNALGLVKTAQPNEPRLTFNPVTLEPEGLLVEAGRTNLFLHSEDYTQTAWSKTGSEILSSSILAPDGETLSQTLSITSNGNGQGVLSQSASTGNTAAISFYARRVNCDFVQASLFFTNGVVRSFFFNLVTGDVGNITSSGSASVLSHKSYKRIDGWVYCTASITASETFVSASLQPVNSDLSLNGVISNQVNLWGLQLEPNNYALSYIKTTTTPVTRGADSAIRDSNDEFNRFEGTFVVRFKRNVPKVTGLRENILSFVNSDSTVQGVGILSETSTNNTYQMRIRLAGDGEVRAFPAQPFQLDEIITLVGTYNTTSKRIRTYAKGQMNELVYTTDIDLGQFDRLRVASSRNFFGTSPSNPPNISVLYSRYYPKELSQDECLALTRG